MATIISTKPVHDDLEERLRVQGKLNRRGRLTFWMVAKATGLDKRTVSQLYRGTLEFVSRRTLDVIVRYYECDYGDLFHRVADDDTSLVQAASTASHEG